MPLFLLYLFIFTRYHLSFYVYTYTVLLTDPSKSLYLLYKFNIYFFVIGIRLLLTPSIKGRRRTPRQSYGLVYKAPFIDREIALLTPFFLSRYSHSSSFTVHPACNPCSSSLVRESSRVKERLSSTDLIAEQRSSWSREGHSDQSPWRPVAWFSASHEPRLPTNRGPVSRTLILIYSLYCSRATCI